MNLKVYYRSPVIWNIILYIILSFAFIFFQEIFRNTTSIIEKDLFKNFVLEHYLVAVIFTLTICSFFIKNKAITLFLFFITVSATFLLTSYNLFLEFSKFSLIILFFYLLIAFYLYQFYSVDIEESYYNPQFNNNMLFEPMLKQIPVVAIVNEKEVARGYLTNWSEEGCFIYLPEPFKIRGRVNLKVSFLERSFMGSGVVVSSTSKNNGYGIKFKSKQKAENLDSLGWGEFYEIIEEMGLKPELLK